MTVKKLIEKNAGHWNVVRAKILETTFKSLEMNWDASDLADGLTKFKQYSSLIFAVPLNKKRPKE